MIRRPPGAALRPYVELVWGVAPPSGRAAGAEREHVLPTGAMHLAFRLSGPPLRVFESAEDRTGRCLGEAVVGGARSTYYVRDVASPSCSVGAMLRPGAAESLFGASAEELSERHTRLDDLWGAAAHRARERLLEEGKPERRLAILESLLALRLRGAPALHPAVAHALDRFDRAAGVDEVVRESGYSHRHFIALFRSTVGLTPKVFCRVRRFRKALRRASTDRSASWAEIAVETGFSDQAHFHRDFVAFAGVTPGAYRTIAPAFPSHVGVPAASRKR